MLNANLWNHTYTKPMAEQIIDYRHVPCVLALVNKASYISACDTKHFFPLINSDNLSILENLASKDRASTAAID